MKTIKLKTIQEVIVINNQEIETEIKTIDLLRVAINSPVQGGYSVSEMAQRLKLLDVINNAGKIDTSLNEIYFEDADFQALKLLVKDTKWSIISRTIVDFVNQFNTI